MTAARMSCLVPFCRRTRAARNGEWICGDHWPPVPLRLKRLLTHYKRRRDFAGYMRVWIWCRSAATEIAAGVRR